MGRKTSSETIPDNPNPVIVATSKNILSGYERGIGLNAMLWFFNINARIYQGHYNSFTDTTSKLKTRIPFNNYASFSLNSYMYGELFYKINGFLFINYNGPSINAQVEPLALHFMDLESTEFLEIIQLNSSIYYLSQKIVP